MPWKRSGPSAAGPSKPPHFPTMRKSACEPPIFSNDSRPTTFGCQDSSLAAAVACRHRKFYRPSPSNRAIMSRSVRPTARFKKPRSIWTIRPASSGPWSTTSADNRAIRCGPTSRGTVAARRSSPVRRANFPPPISARSGADHRRNSQLQRKTAIRRSAVRAVEQLRDGVNRALGRSI